MVCPVRVTQALGITATAYLAGQTTALSTICVPALLMTQSASSLARQTRSLELKGYKVAISIIGLGSTFFGWLSWRVLSCPRMRRMSSANTTSAVLYGITAALLLSLAPISKFLIEPVNAAITQREAELMATEAPVKDDSTASAEALASVHKLVDDWATRNLMRGIITTIAAVSASLGYVFEHKGKMMGAAAGAGANCVCKK